MRSYENEDGFRFATRAERHAALLNLKMQRLAQETYEATFPSAIIRRWMELDYDYERAEFARVEQLSEVLQ